METTEDSQHSSTHASIADNLARYRHKEQECYAMLRADEQRGMAYAAENAGQAGEQLQSMLDELLEHSLCKQLNEKPRVYIHHDFDSQFATFGNVILVPFYDVTEENLNDAKQKQMVKAAIAHELGHIIRGDTRPEMRVKRQRAHQDKEMERQTDLIAAHLCGDGGANLADELERRLALERQIRPCLPANSPALEHAESAKHRYPPIEERIGYLRNWSERFRQGQPLPKVELPRQFGTQRG